MLEQNPASKVHAGRLAIFGNEVSSRPDSALRVIVVGALPPPINGMTMATRLLLISLRRSGFTVVHLDTSDRRSLKNVGRLDLANVLIALRALVRFLRLLFRQRPDSVYVPISQNTLGFLRDALFLLPSRIAGLPVVVHLHGGYFDRFYETAGPLTRWLVRVCLGGDTYGIVLCADLRRCLTPFIPPNRINVVPNGIDPTEFDVSHERSNQRGIRALYLGMLSREKGVLDVLAAARLVRAEEPSIEFTFAGEWQTAAEEQQAQHIVTEGGLERAVRWRGVVEGQEKTRLLMESDIFVFPTSYVYEGLPFALLEAMAAGLAIITTNHRCIGEVVDMGSAAILVRAGDERGIAAAILRLARDETLRVQYGAVARKRLLDNYTLDLWSESMETTLKRTFGKRSSRA